MLNPATPDLVVTRHGRRPGLLRAPCRIMLFAAVLVFACCLGARAAVVEAEGVEREVDTPAGAQRQTLEEAAPPPMQVASPEAGSAAAAPSPGATASARNFEPLPVVTETPQAAEDSLGGGSSQLLGFLVVGLLVVLVGVFLFAARGRGRR